MGDYTEFIFEEKAEMPFEEFVDLVLNMRGSNVATVKDVKTQQRHVKSMINGIVKDLSVKMDDQFEKTMLQLQDLKTPDVEDDSEGEEQEADADAVQEVT